LLGVYSFDDQDFVDLASAHHTGRETLEDAARALTAHACVPAIVDDRIRIFHVTDFTEFVILSDFACVFAVAFDDRGSNLAGLGVVRRVYHELIFKSPGYRLRFLLKLKLLVLL
jgi:hypothetical protein